jgi:hypothetical protein
MLRINVHDEGESTSFTIEDDIMLLKRDDLSQAGKNFETENTRRKK